MPPVPVLSAAAATIADRIRTAARARLGPTARVDLAVAELDGLEAAVTATLFLNDAHPPTPVLQVRAGAHDLETLAVDALAGIERLAAG